MSQSPGVDRQGIDVEVLGIDACVFDWSIRLYCNALLLLIIDPQSTIFFQLIALVQFYRLKRNSAICCSCITM